MKLLNFSIYWQALISDTKRAQLIKRLVSFCLFLGMFVLVILYVPPPTSWEEASVFQILAFFLPILLGVTALVDILVHYLPHSFIVGLGVILIIAFLGVNQLNFLTGTLVILITAFSFRMFPRMRMPRFRLTSGSKIPKLHIGRIEEPRIRRLRRLRKLR